MRVECYITIFQDGLAINDNESFVPFSNALSALILHDLQLKFVPITPTFSLFFSKCPVCCVPHQFKDLFATPSSEMSTSLSSSNVFISVFLFDRRNHCAPRHISDLPLPLEM